MVVDEELKMMCDRRRRGRRVVGPRLKEMAHLAHTEYELRGRSTGCARGAARDDVRATVTGSPVENACRVIERHEPGGRGYYAGRAGADRPRLGGAQTLDSPDPHPHRRHRRGRPVRVPVGATLVGLRSGE